VPQSSEQPLRSLHVGSDSAESLRTSLFVVDRHSVGLSRYACYRHRCYTSPGPLVWDVSLPIERLMAIFGEHPSHGCASESSCITCRERAERAARAAGRWPMLPGRRATTGSLHRPMGLPSSTLKNPTHRCPFSSIPEVEDDAFAEGEGEISTTVSSRPV
jgi:hypothetical protein